MIAQKFIQGLTIKEFVFKYIKIFGVLLLVFYFVYPQALDVAGKSFILPAGAFGIMLYAWNRFPFEEVSKVIAGFLFFLFICYTTAFYNDLGDPFIMSYLRSQMAWFFTAYLIVFIIFNIHKNPTAEVIVGYLAAAVTLQCVITFAMNQNEWANGFFYSLQMKNIYTEEIKEMTEEQRLLGYGTAFFGAGMVAGYGLILLTYLISKIKLTTFQFGFFVLTYAFVFFIGLFSARTTTVGLAVSVILLFGLYFVDKTTNKKQPIRFIWVSILAFALGAGLATQYFPDYTDWAFEMFDNFKKTGKFSTSSSDALYVLFYLPPEFSQLVIGTGRMEFWGNDMGYTRLIHYVGFVGLFVFFVYQLWIVYLCLTKDLTMNILLLTLVVYVMLLNVKGFTDLNPVLYLFFFFFLFHKYYRFYPQLYKEKLIEKIEAQKKEGKQPQTSIEE